MNSDFKKTLTKNVLSRIDELFPEADTKNKDFVNKIAKISVISTIAVIEEYEKLKNS